MERLSTVKTDIQERILIRKLDQPSHAGEIEFGFSLVFCGKWQLEIAYWANTTSGSLRGFDYIDLPDDVWNESPCKALRDLVKNETRMDPYLEDRSSCIEWEKLEKLFESKRCS